jgi:two-component system LytT family response regulator
MKAIIIEDETVAAQSLQNLIEEVDADIQTISILQSIDESIEWLQAYPMPNLVFMDIHLADGSSFSIFEKIDITCPVIFTTAYDEYALKAFEVNSIDYLLKPINKKELERAIRKYKNFSFHPEQTVDLINKLLTSVKQNSVNLTTTYKTYFLVPEKDKLIPLATNDIAYIYIDAKIVKAVTHTDRTYYLDQILDDLMQQLNPSLFFRANRQYIVAHKAVKNLSVWFGSKLLINLNVPAPERILVSKARAGEFKKWFVKAS